jgi:hypothetical protein
VQISSPSSNRNWVHVLFFHFLIETQENRLQQEKKLHLFTPLREQLRNGIQTISVVQIYHQFLSRPNHTAENARNFQRVFRKVLETRTLQYISPSTVLEGTEPVKVPLKGNTSTQQQRFRKSAQLIKSI